MPFTFLASGIRLPAICVVTAFLICEIDKKNNASAAPPMEVTADVLVTSGPDLVTTDVINCAQLARVGGIGFGTIGMSCDTWMCNDGDQNLDWHRLPNTAHPVISVNLYRLETVGGSEKFEQIGYSWVKHTFGSSNFTCGQTCVSPGSTSLDGPGCGDDYAAQQFVECDLGPRSSINPFTGVMPSGANLGAGGGCGSNYPANNHIGHVHTPISHTAEVRDADLMHAGARYFAEGGYVSGSEFTSGNGNQNNNNCYRQVGVGGPDSQGMFTFYNGLIAISQTPGIYAWTGAMRSLIEPAPLQDGQAVLACKVTNIGPLKWRYEFAIENVNLDRGIGSFSIPLPGGVTITNVGFHAVAHHPFGETSESYSDAPWIATATTSALAWSTESFATNPLANAIRWGTLYNFRFDADSPPNSANVTIGFFKTGAPIQVAAQAPYFPGFTDCNNNGRFDFCDVDCTYPGCNVPGCGQSGDCNHDFVPDECQGDCNANGIPDVCEADCNNNFVADACEILSNPALDCNHNGKLDACDISSTSSGDCNGNGIPDECEPQVDCNHNGIADFCDLASGASQDFDRNGVPDECQHPAAITIYIDDDAPGDPGPGNPMVSDPLEDGSAQHPYDSIQKAVNRSFPGDSVLLQDGTFTGNGNHDVDYGGRDITIRCANGLGHCTVDLQNLSYNAFIFQTHETRSARLEGIWIINPSIQPIPPGYYSPPAPIITNGTGPTIESCEIDFNASQAPIYNTPYSSGPNAVYLTEGSTPRFHNCRVVASKTAFVCTGGSVADIDDCFLDGAQVILDGGAANLDHCILSHANAQSGLRGALELYNSSNVTLTNTAVTQSAGNGISMMDPTGTGIFAGTVNARNLLIADCAVSGILEKLGPVTLVNSALVNNLGGIVQQGTVTAVIVNSILRGRGGAQISSPSQQLVQVSYSDVQGGWPGTGNIDVDAMFVDAANGDYHLQQGSPCIDAGDSNSSGLPSTDFDSGPRFVDDLSVPDTGHAHGVLPIDMGPYEFADCNGNNVDDAIDIQQGISLDCNLNGIPDDCDLSTGLAQDCNANNIPDNCDIASGLDPDCQHNGVPDSCDIAAGASIDTQPHDGVPDECVFVPPALAEPGGVNKNRYISFAILPQSLGMQTAIRVELTSLIHPTPLNLPQYPVINYSALQGQIRYVGPVQNCVESENPPTTFKCAILQCSPLYIDWYAVLGSATLHVRGAEIVPSSMYSVRQLPFSCRGSELACTTLSDALPVSTQRWGDVIVPFQDPSASAPLTQPNISDVAAIVDKFKNLPTAISLARADLNPATPDGSVNIADVASGVDGFKGLAYAFSAPATCP
ncbi:MAG: right-handed parallel beta-helix repeat-containing protein [Planctomycetes bacterium]|nr:right-handed parallel beta-helix repeat-containing protein [Planctomycetota bacterium]MBI3834919.1 right-handed parallel beta-helix repeat-containing protein [Planctomycetota bacterium]